MYEFTPFFLYKLQFMAELLLAEGMIIFRFKRRNYFFARIIGAVLVCFGLAFAIPIIAYNAFYCTVVFIALFVVSLIAIRFCFDVDWITILFYALTGYAIQHLAYEIFDLVVVLTGVNGGLPMGNYGDQFGNSSGVDQSGVNGTIFTSNIYVIGIWLLIYFTIYLYGYLFVSYNIPKYNNREQKNFELIAVVVVIIISSIVFSAITTYYSVDNFDKGYIILSYVYNIFCTLLAIYIQFGFSRRKKLQEDYNTVSKLWEQQKAQYELSKANINFINLKCHDLKHQIRSIGRRSEIDSDTLKEMENVISIYDSNVKTENEALDIILTEKSLQCARHNIQLSCIAAGKELSFMANADLYSLFGNLIDNAIEAVKDLPDDKRIISLSVKTVKAFVYITIYNYYKGELKFDGKMPVTTKPDKINHGFGMKSIQFVCDKYGGEISISTRNNIFTLNMILPVNKTSCVV